MHVIVIIFIILVILIALCILLWPVAKPKMMKYVQNKIMSNLPTYSNPAELNLAENRLHGKLTYSHKGANYSLYLPYDKKLLRKVGYMVYYEHKNMKIDITQEPGIPYYVTAEILGGGVIRVYKDDEIVHEFKENESVKF
jgi:hypothetical protein